MIRLSNHHLLAAALSGSLLLTGCVVDGQCFGDADCSGSQICREGQCVFECIDNEDCPGCRRCEDNHCTECCRNSDCSREFYCEAEVCLPATECFGCEELPHGTGSCWHGLCIVESCDASWHDANSDASDGCEYNCVPTAGGVEVCDASDNDCDGRVDEDYNLALDIEHCGECNHPCPAPPHADAVCAAGQCTFRCHAGRYDVDGNPDNGCESDTCQPTAGGVEIFDLRDNDCNGEVDEGIAKDEVGSCGPLCQVCSFDHATAACVGGACVMGPCETHWHDWDHDPATGCEEHCVPTTPPDEVCDATDNDCDGQIDENLVCHCPDDMVLVEEAYCIDRYEASRPDATVSTMGSDTSQAVSQAGVMPWRYVSLQEAADACAAAGKRLCTPAEWEQACRGPDGTEYCYGDSYVVETCNGIDVFWPNFHIEPTGSFPGCTNEYGVFDINGNVWERVQGGAGRGGAYNCSDSEALHRCSFVAAWGTDPISNFGFRCCL